MKYEFIFQFKKNISNFNYPTNKFIIPIFVFQIHNTSL
ncbi:hypothetical protein FEM08_17360 [Flavobacterium gilvum]|nr:hypothetical protein FEM08_17360 [Flavobacterium gilvum]